MLDSFLARVFPSLASTRGLYVRRGELSFVILNLGPVRNSCMSSYAAVMRDRSEIDKILKRRGERV